MTKEEEEAKLKEEKDEKGVSLYNRQREFEAKLEAKYAKELEQTRKELDELKNMRNLPPQTPNIVEKNDPKEKLMRFVENPDAYIEQTLQAREFQRQIPEAERWLSQQKGYSKEARARVDALIFENKLNTPYHTPMERATTAWKLYEREVTNATNDSVQDESRREASITKSGGEGNGKTVPKVSVNTHNELIKKLAAAEKSGDIDASIKILDMLQDHPMENSVIRGM